MADINVNEYIRTADGKIGKFDRYSSMPNTSIYKSPFNCFIKLQGRKTPLQCHRDYIVNHSKNIIDLIEVGDYVNGQLIENIHKKEKDRIYYEFLKNQDGSFEVMEVCELKNIESIVTKEKFASMEYRLEV